LFIAQPWGLMGVVVRPLVIADFEPGGQSLVELGQREYRPGPNLGFELSLGRFEKALDQAARRWVSHAAVQQANVQGGTGPLQRLSVVNLGIVQIQLAAGAV